MTFFQPDQSGTAVVTVTATDPHGAAVEISFTVTVLSPEEQSQEVLALIETWQTNGQVNAGNANAMSQKVQNAVRVYEQGDLAAAINMLNALKNQILARVRPGGISAAQADYAIGLVDDLIDSMQP